MQFEPESQADVDRLRDGFPDNQRKIFITRVFAILSVQILITVIMCMATYFNKDLLNFQYYHSWIIGLSSLMIIAVEIALLFYPSIRQHPKNILLALVFTLCFSEMISISCAMCSHYYSSSIVVLAAVMTLVMVVSLTAYAILTKEDFTPKIGASLLIGQNLVLLGIYTIFSPFLYNLYCFLAVTLFGIYLVMDIQMIIGKNRRIQLSPDDYVLCSLLIYLDIIQLFLLMIEFGKNMYRKHRVNK